MGIGPFPSPAQLSNHIQDQALLRLGQQHPDLPVPAILRHGAIIGCESFYSSRQERCMAEARSRIAASEAARGSFASGMVIGAGELTGGAGRFRRSWHAPPGGLWFTLVLVNTLRPHFSRLLPLMAGLACWATLRESGLSSARLKWVNDIILAGRKVAGILSESLVGECSGEEYILIGLGLNVNNRDFPPELSSSATSLAAFAGHDFDLDQLACELLSQLRFYYGLLVYLDEGGGGDTRPFMDLYRQACDSVGRQVRYGFDVQQQPLYEARVKGISDDGSLVMTLADGSEISEGGGELVYLPAGS
ncbi:MAG: biotin--[acetyl-CoA-carboxylase] ligase [Thermodesulfobacteriota bacterium]